MSAPAAVPHRVLFPGYSVPRQSYTAAPPRYTSVPRLVVILGAVLSAFVAAVVAASVLTTKPTVQYSCPPDCGRPPTGVPVQASPRWVAGDRSFSVSYPAPGTAYDLTMEDDGVSAVYTGGDGGTMELFGVPAQGRSAEQVVDDLIRDKQPDATVAYVLPNATVGYQPGYGVVLDVYPTSGSGVSTRTRIVILAAVKNDLTLIGAAIGPYRQFTPEDGPGPPSGANVQLAEDLGKYVNSFLWKGDPPR
jgi:hypothetical protein